MTKADIEKAKQEIKQNVEFKKNIPDQLGGQQTGLITPKQRLYSDELDLTIETSFYKSQLKNRELLYVLFDLAVDELIK